MATTTAQQLATYQARLKAYQAPTATAAQKADVAKLQGYIATDTATLAAANTAAHAPSPITPAVTQPGALSTINGQAYVNTGSTGGTGGPTYQPGGVEVSLAAPSSDTYSQLQQLLAIQANPSLVASNPAWTSVPQYATPAARAAEIAQLGGQFLVSGPAYEGGYSGLTGAQIAQVKTAADQYQAAGGNLNPALLQAINQAAATTPLNAPASAPYTAAAVAAAAQNVSVAQQGSYGSLPTSSVPVSYTGPVYNTSPVAESTPAPADPSAATTTPQLVVAGPVGAASPVESSTSDQGVSATGGGAPDTSTEGTTTSSGLSETDWLLIGGAVIAGVLLMRSKKGGKVL